MDIYRYYTLLVLISLWQIPVWSQYDSLSYDGLQRSFLLHFPPAYDGRENLPLVIAMHGGGGSAANLQNQSGLSHTADEKGFIVVYPEGTREGFLKLRTWNAGWCCGHASATGIDDVGFIDTLLDVLIEQYTIDTNRIYATGMSNGGFMSYRLACELSDRIAAIAPVAGSQSLTVCNPESPVPIIHFHSYLDGSVPYLGGIGDGISDHYNSPLDSVLETWAGKNGCQSGKMILQDDLEVTKYQWTDCDCSADIEWYLTKDGGHSWPGGNQTPIGDPASQVINANELMWEFFSHHSLECSMISSSKNDVREASPGITFPNPSSGIFSLRSSLYENTRISLFDLSGRKISFIKKDQQITIPEFNNGIYFLKIQNGNRIFSEKLLLER